MCLVVVCLTMGLPFESFSARTCQHLLILVSHSNERYLFQKESLTQKRVPWEPSYSNSKAGNGVMLFLKLQRSGKRVGFRRL